MLLLQQVLKRLYWICYFIMFNFSVCVTTCFQTTVLNMLLHECFTHHIPFFICFSISLPVLYLSSSSLSLFQFFISLSILYLSSSSLSLFQFSISLPVLYLSFNSLSLFHFSISLPVLYLSCSSPSLVHVSLRHILSSWTIIVGLSYFFRILILSNVLSLGFSSHWMGIMIPCIWLVIDD